VYYVWFIPGYSALRTPLTRYEPKRRIITHPYTLPLPLPLRAVCAVKFSHVSPVPTVVKTLFLLPFPLPLPLPLPLLFDFMTVLGPCHAGV
jgi:hypothetical protein